MTRLYLDTEFNGFGGALMSVALVPSTPGAAEFYRVLDLHFRPEPWVEHHVIPHLGRASESRDVVSAALAEYLRSVASPVLVADWPTDFEHVLALLITGPGQMQRVPDFGMEFMRLEGFNTAYHSKVPHNALHDARALRDYCERQRLGQGGPHS